MTHELRVLCILKTTKITRGRYGGKGSHCIHRGQQTAERLGMLRRRSSPSVTPRSGVGNSRSVSPSNWIYRHTATFGSCCLWLYMHRTLGPPEFSVTLALLLKPFQCTVSDISWTPSLSSVLSLPLKTLLTWSEWNTLSVLVTSQKCVKGQVALIFNFHLSLAFQKPFFPAFHF